MRQGKSEFILVLMLGAQWFLNILPSTPWTLRYIMYSLLTNQYSGQLVHNHSRAGILATSNLYNFQTFRMSVIYQTQSETLKKTDTRHDLDFFAEVYGVNSKLLTPEYEVRSIEKSQEMQTLYVNPFPPRGSPLTSKIVWH